MSIDLAAPLLVAALVVALDLWVYADAQAHVEQGQRVVFRAGSFVLETPVSWCVACLLLWVVFFPLYLRARS